MLGEYDFFDEKLRDSVGILPSLNQPPETHQNSGAARAPKGQSHQFSYKTAMSQLTPLLQ